MPHQKPLLVPVNEASLLGAYQRSGAFTDCYELVVPGAVPLSAFILAFYTTPLFALERWLIACLMRVPSSNQQVHLLAGGQVDRLSAWHVENRSANEILLISGQTRSWLSVAPGPGGTTRLLFGSAVVPPQPGEPIAWVFRVLLRFHDLYARLLLAAAAKRLR